MYTELASCVIISLMNIWLERFYRLSRLGQCKMKMITVVVLALLIAAASLSTVSGCATDKASVAELSKALKQCYTLEHSPYNMHAFDQFTVKDLEVINKTKYALGTIWSVRAKLYDPDDRYVEDIAGNPVKSSLGSWSCQ